MITGACSIINKDYTGAFRTVPRGGHCRGAMTYLRSENVLKRLIYSNKTVTETL